MSLRTAILRPRSSPLLPTTGRNPVACHWRTLRHTGCNPVGDCHAVAVADIEDAIRFRPAGVRRRVAIRQCAGLPATRRFARRCRARACDAENQHRPLRDRRRLGAAPGRRRGRCLHDRADRVGRPGQRDDRWYCQGHSQRRQSGQDRGARSSACPVWRAPRRNGLAARSDRRCPHGDRQGSAGRKGPHSQHDACAGIEPLQPVDSTSAPAAVDAEHEAIGDAFEEAAKAQESVKPRPQAHPSSRRRRLSPGPRNLPSCRRRTFRERHLLLRRKQLHQQRLAPTLSRRRKKPPPE